MFKEGQNGHCGWSEGSKGERSRCQRGGRAEAILNHVPLTKEIGMHKGEGAGKRSCMDQFIWFCAGKHGGKDQGESKMTG